MDFEYLGTSHPPDGTQITSYGTHVAGGVLVLMVVDRPGRQPLITSRVTEGELDSHPEGSVIVPETC